MGCSSATIRSLRSLIEGYAARRVATPVVDANFKELLVNFRATFQKWQKSEEMTASDFNLLNTLQISNDELRHSMMLAWLLDHRIERAGTHAQGNLGFRLFLKELDLDETYADGEYWVSREVCGGASRVDLEIAVPGNFIVHIENKIYSDEGPDQTRREWMDLLKRANDFRVKRHRTHGIFLTLDGRQPFDQNFVAISWAQIANVLEKFAMKAKAPEVRILAAHYARALRGMVSENVKINRDETDKPT